MERKIIKMTKREQREYKKLYKAFVKVSYELFMRMIVEDSTLSIDSFMKEALNGK